MAGVTINSGPVNADDYLRDVPQDKWSELMRVRRSFLRTNLAYDCRRLLEFVEDADKMYAPLGFTSADDFIERGLELDLDDVGWAVEGLKRIKPDEPIPFQKALELGRHGGKRTKGQGVNNTLVRGSTNRDYILARLDRDRPDLAARVRANELSANAAAIEAGFGKKPNLVDQTWKLYLKMSDDERAAFNQLVDSIS